MSTKDEKTVIDPRKRVKVIATEKHPGFKQSKERHVPEHMVAHLVAKGMIEDPAGKKK